MNIDDYNFFEQHRKELAARYPDQWLLIKDGLVLSAADSLKEALETTYGKGMKEGDCLIHYCRKDGKKKMARIERAHPISYNTTYAGR